jgi:tetratricopeptide (TPR) repeat protein
MTKRNILLALVLILSFTVILAFMNWRINAGWQNTPGGLWLVLGNSLTYATGFIVTVFTIVNLLGGFNRKSASQNDGARFIHQLPDTEKNFTGRVPELLELEEQFSKSEINVCGIHGMGGLGKTALTIAFANKIAKKYDADLFLDMRGHSDNTATPEEAMLHVVRSFNPTYSGLQNKSLIAGAYRSILKEKKTIILLDNVKDEASIQDLIPPTGSMLLFTSRRKFSISNSFQLNLPLMTNDEAVQLLIKVASRLNKEEASQIARLCGYLPNSLVKAAYMLKQYQSMDVGEYISLLSKAQTRVGLVEASISISYNLLSNELKTAWRYLSIFPDDFGLEVACFILGCDSKQGQKILTELLELSLVNPDLAFPSVPNEFDIAEYRVRFHDLDRLFARTKLKNNERKVLELKLAEYYATVLSTINVYFDRGGTDFLVSLSAFDREWANIEHAKKITEKYYKINDRAGHLCLHYCMSSLRFLDIRFPKEILIEWSKTALRIARRRKDMPNEGRALNNLGTAYSDIGEMDQGIPLLLKAIEIAQKSNMLQSEISPLDNLANAYRRKGDTEKALEYHLKAYERAKEVNDKDSEASILNNLGNVYLDMEDFKNAFHYHQLALKMAKANSLEEVTALLNLTADYIIQGNIFKAVHHNWLALQLSKKMKIKSYEQRSWNSFRSMFKSLLSVFFHRIRNIRGLTSFSNHP